MAGRAYNVEDRIRELGEDPATAYARAKADGMTGDVPPPSSLELGPTDPTVAPNELGVAAPAPDPLPGGKAKPAKAAAAPAPAPAPAAAPEPQHVDTGTIADTQQELPSLAPFKPGMVAMEPPASLSELFHADSGTQKRANPDFDENTLRDGYAPIVRMLGLPATDNPAAFMGADDPATDAKIGYAGAPSQLATQMNAGQGMPWGGQRMANRALQEQLIAQAIKERRLKQPGFAPGIPDTVDGLHAYFNKQQRAAVAADQATLARSPGGVAAAAAELAGGTVGYFSDPTNWLGLAIPGGEGKTFLQIAGREALTNGIVAAAGQPAAAHNAHELGQKYTAGDAIENVAEGAIGGAVLGTSMHYAGEGLKATGVPQAIGGAVSSASSAAADRIFHALPEPLQAKWGQAIVKDWARRLDQGDKLDDVFSDLSNRELTTLSRTIVGDERWTPQERSAANVLERAQEVGESSPYQPGPVGDGTNETGLASAMKALFDRETPQPTELPSGSKGSGSEAASPAAAPERPPAALSTAERPQSDAQPRRFFMREEGEDQAIESFKSKVYHAENNTGNVNAKNPRSSASGPAQFTDETFRDYYRKVYGQDPGEHPAQDLKNNPEVQARLLDRLTHDNAAKLKSIGETVNEGNLYLMHVLGSGDGPKLFKAAADTPIEKLVSAKVLDENPQWHRGESASEVIAWAHGKMGEHVSAVSARPGFSSNLDAASEDPEIAQLNAEALQLEQEIVAADQTGWSEKPDGSKAPVYGARVPASQIGVDADRFQFKSGGDEHGVTDRLQGVEQWDPVAAGKVTLWQDNDGKYWVANGHQRTGLARRIGDATGQDIPMDADVWREADGVTADDARVMAALTNIQEDSATRIDAAKIGRYNMDALERAAKRLPPKSPLVRDARALAKLSDDAFGMVYNGHLDASHAAVIGHLLPDQPEAHAGIAAVLKKLNPSSRAQAESIVRQAIAAGFHKEEQIGLFGESEHVTSLMLEKAKMHEKLLRELAKMRLFHKTAVEGADTLEKAGSKIARERSAKEAQANAEAIDLVNRLAYRAGPVADILNEAARELAAGGKAAAIAKHAAEQLRELDLRALAREAPLDGATGELDGGIGREGGAAETDPQLFAEPGDQEQPGLLELERATERFSDPDGEATRQQADSLVHDLKAEVAGATRRDQIKAATAELEKAKPGELRTVEPFPKEEPGYHRFRYVAEDGTAVGGNYTVDGNVIEGFNVGDTHNRAELGPVELRKLLAQVHAEHPEAKYVHAYRMTGARARTGSGEQEIWLELTDKGLKLLPGEPQAEPSIRGPIAGSLPVEKILEKQRGASLEDLVAMAHENQPKLEALGEELAGKMDGVRFIAPPRTEKQPHGVKSLERTKEKLANEGYSHPSELKDLARGTFAVADPAAGAKIAGELGHMFPVYDKGWIPANGYIDRKLIVQFPNGGAVEVQILPEPIADYKFTGEGHKLYEIVRDPNTPIDEFDRALSEMRKGYEERLAGTSFETLGKEPANSSAESSRPSTRALRASATDAGSQSAPDHTNALLGDSTATGRSSSSKYLMDNAPASELDMGDLQDPGKAARDRQLLQLGTEAPLRPEGIDRVAAEDMARSFRLGDEGDEISLHDLLAELEADDKAIQSIKDCL